MSLTFLINHHIQAILPSGDSSAVDFETCVAATIVQLGEYLIVVVTVVSLFRFQDRGRGLKGLSQIA